MKRIKPVILLMLALLMAACTDREKHCSLTLSVLHEEDGTPLIMDALRYTNEAGNPYLVNEVQWFISNLELEDYAGNRVMLAETWYIDTNIPETQTLRVSEVPTRCYRSLRFTFGMNDADNQSGVFSNPPESNMFWPDELGGGYHYMKLNGKFQNADSLLVPLAIHLGRGQNTNHTEFYDNSFTVELPIDLDVYANRDYSVGIVMNINKWFRSPHVYDFNAFGSAIMQKQEAQQLLKENGADVFTAKNTEDMLSIAEISKEILQKAAPKPHFMTWKNFKSTISNIKNKYRS